MLSNEVGQLKDDANAFFNAQHYTQAINLYTEAIKLDQSQAALFGNRSIAFLRCECFGAALEDATKAIELDPSYIKGYYRRAMAFMALGKYKEAQKDLETICKVRPNDKDAKLRLEECRKIIRKMAFLKAIAVDVDKSVAATIDVDSMVVDKDYDGPHLVDGKVTPEFMNQLIETYRSQKLLDKKYAFQIILQALKLFEKAPSLVDVNILDESKFTVCGDIHGQYFDLLNIFKLNGLPSEDNPYLFNGDFVDRGSFSVECILTLLGFKVLYPNHFFMSRGNHESHTMNQMYGFEGEVRSKYSQKMYDLFSELFNFLPLAHCLNNKVLVMHGGLFSQPNVSLDDIRKVNRNRQPPEDGIMCEILWSDPMPNNGIIPSKRGVGIQFGPDATENFCSFNKLDYIIRSHEVKEEGYEIAHNGKCITLFSAPNYCDTIGNKGAFITMKGKTLEPEFTTYTEVPHPDIKPMAYANHMFAMA